MSEMLTDAELAEIEARVEAMGPGRTMSGNVFIAHARADIPALIAEVRAERERRYRDERALAAADAFVRKIEGDSELMKWYLGDATRKTRAALEAADVWGRRL